MNPISRKNKKRTTAKKADAAVTAKEQKKINPAGKSMTLKPRVSEKTYALSEQGNTYVFEVPKTVSKQFIGDAVAAQYEVGVVSVRISATPGKTQRTYKRGGRISHNGQRSSVRKAFVTLKEGDKLPVFASVEDSDNPNKESK
jgi:large subunit ribosomal protein L23